MMETNIIHCGDALEVMRKLPDCTIDAIVTDPPYGISFMGKKWDYDVPAVAVWVECLRVLKPGGHLISACGTRTQHRMAVNIEDAGFKIRDLIAWLYGSGFPKSLDVSKSIDKMMGVEREIICDNPNNRPNCAGNMTRSMAAPITIQPITAPATPAAKQWHGWGTALKPAMELWTLARKPLIGTVAENVLRYGTGGINVDGCRVGESKNVPASISKKHPANCYGKYAESGETPGIGGHDPNLGRFPANVIHDGSEEVVSGFPRAAASKSGGKAGWQDQYIGGTYKPIERTGYDDPPGSVARFFYCAKASQSERDEGLHDSPDKPGGFNSETSGQHLTRRDGGAPGLVKNNHPTVKPIALMRYLCRLITPLGGIVLDPFCGSGSTLIAAKLEGFNWLGIELNPEYVEMANRRIAGVHYQPSLFEEAK